MIKEIRNFIIEKFMEYAPKIGTSIMSFLLKKTLAITLLHIGFIGVMI